MGRMVGGDREQSRWNDGGRQHDVERPGQRVRRVSAVIWNSDSGVSLPLPSHYGSGKSLAISGPQFPHL